MAGSGDDSDVYSWNGTSLARVWDATSRRSVSSGANVDGLILTDATHFYLSFSGDTSVPGPGNIQDEDVVGYAAGTWSVFFDGTAQGLTSGNLDLDAISFGETVAPPPPPPPPPPGDADPLPVHARQQHAPGRQWRGGRQ